MTVHQTFLQIASPIICFRHCHKLQFSRGNSELRFLFFFIILSKFPQMTSVFWIKDDAFGNYSVVQFEQSNLVLTDSRFYEIFNLQRRHLYHRVESHRSVFRAFSKIYNKAVLTKIANGFQAFLTGSKLQKQPSIGVLRKRCSENMQQIYRRTPVLKCDFNKVAIPLWHRSSPLNLLHISNTFLQEHLRRVASENTPLRSRLLKSGSQKILEISFFRQSVILVILLVFESWRLKVYNRQKQLPGGVL